MAIKFTAAPSPTAPRDNIRAQMRELLSQGAMTAPELRCALRYRVTGEVLRRWLQEDRDAGLLRSGGGKLRWEAECTVLYWSPAPKAQTYEEWASYQADSAPPGTYQPNMDETWQHRWKAKICGTTSEGLAELRVEIRKTVSDRLSYSCAQVLLIVYADGRARLSMNGTAVFSPEEFTEMPRAVAEAGEAMRAFGTHKQERTA